MIKKFLSCTQGFRRQSVLASFFVACEAVLEVFLPFLMSNIIDIGITNRDLSYVVRIGLLMISLSLLSLGLGVISGRFAAIASTGFARNLRRKLFYKLQDFSFANIDHFSTASLITRLTVDVTNTQMSYMMVIRMLVRSPVMLVAAFIMAFRINPSLSTIFLFAIPVLAISFILIASLAYPRFETMLKKYDAMTASIQEKLVGIRLIKSFVREKHEEEDFRKTANLLRDFHIRAERIVIYNMPIMMATIYGCIIAVFWFGGRQILAGTMLSGELFSFLAYIAQILISLLMISMVFLMIVISRASMQRINECLEEKIDITDKDFAPGEAAPQPADGSIEFRQVNFSYSQDADTMTLKDIDLTIQSGETIGIIGGTGSGKTTLVQLIPRLYDTLAGEVRVGGHNVRDYRIRDLRDACAMVLQNNLLFSGTIEENLRWGNADASQAEIEAACRIAQAHDFILNFPKGYQTELGQGGVNVSGGQKQRLTIARALLKKPKILILDDSTSAVDTATDAQIRAGFASKLPDVTTIIIAQRIASIESADRILILDEGCIQDIGTHADLLARNAIYREVYTSQQKGGE